MNLDEGAGMGAFESFEAYCKREKITSEQYKEELWPVWQAGYKAGFASKEKENP